MNAQDWQTKNAQYLSAALEWLRLRLLRLAKQAPNEASPEQIKRAAAAMTALEAGDPPPALILLSLQLGLSKFEREVLLLCVATEFDTRISGLCARVQDDESRAYPTFALSLALFDEPAWEALSPDRPLRYWRLIEINQPGAQPLTKSAIRADERIVSYLKGLNTLDDRLTTFLSPMDSMRTIRVPLPTSQEAGANEIIEHWRRAPEEHSLPIAQLLGPDANSKQLVAAHVAEVLGRQVFRLGPESLPAQLGELKTLARLWQRESLLLPLALYIDAQEIEVGAPEHLASLQCFLDNADGLLFLATRASWARLPRAHFFINIDKPTMAEQQAAWKERFEQRTPELASQLAAQFDFDVTTIAQIAEEILNDPEVNENELADTVWARCRDITRPHLDTLAERIDAKATWDDLVLPPEQTMLLHHIAHQVRQRHRVYEEWGFAKKMNRGLGISALFAGESGTGKTMAAEVIANELHLNLYRIDLSAVVSKYIGETEKNLSRVFNETEKSNVVLFMDEADALFGKRSEVKDSHDRYANIEISYLLQRMESYRGLAILATNRKDDLDPAFKRRVLNVVPFPVPGVKERKLIWQKVFPAEVPKEELDYERLARCPMTGGSIYNAAFRAAFAAAHLNSKVTMQLVLDSVRIVLRKLGHPIINEAEFRA